MKRYLGFLLLATLTATICAESLENVFKSFAAFGAGKYGHPLMDNAKFNKLFKDLKLYDKKFTATDTDIIFNRPEVKNKYDRKINFDQFKKALALAAEKKYGSKDDVGKLIDLIIMRGKGPKVTAESKKTNAGTVDRLTDTGKYTGSHKERFDESGKGKGHNGRQDFEKSEKGYVGAFKG